MNKPHSTLSKKLFLFRMYLVILLLVEMFHCISLLTGQTQERKMVCYPPPPSLCVMLWVLVYFFWPEPPQEGCEGRGNSRRDYWDQAQPRVVMLCCDVRYQNSLHF